jgi:hypothetical protein
MTVLLAYQQMREDFHAACEKVRVKKGPRNAKGFLFIDYLLVYARVLIRTKFNLKILLD